MPSDPPSSSPSQSEYREAISFLFGLEKIGIKFGLENIKSLLLNLGNPHRKYPSIHIAGTNGKGSTVQFLTSILIAAGYRVGTYTSPHLIDFSERIQINATPISKEMITEGISLIQRYIEANKRKQFMPTYFEVSTALAFWCFTQAKINVAVVETGMGGRLDATNVLDPVCSAITNIGLEHQNYLGNTLEEIAYEKSGIIKQGRPLVLGEKKLIPFFQDRCKQVQAKLYTVMGELEVIDENKDGSCFHIRGAEMKYNNLKIGLLGRFQARNASLAVRIWDVLNNLGWGISKEAMRTGLQSTRWPGRMHILQENPLVVADGAHNSSAAVSLMKELPKFLDFRRLFLVFGCMRDKNILELLGSFLPPAVRVILTRSKNDRAEEPEKILELIGQADRAKTIVIRDAQLAVRRALDEAGESDMVLITGSLYVVGDVLSMFQQ